jgi:hypothetical protein
MDSPAHMWSYWRDKHGVVDALDQYPNLLAANKDLQLALFQIRAAEAMIDKIMGELPDDYPEA